MLFSRIKEGTKDRLCVKMQDSCFENADPESLGRLSYIHCLYSLKFL